MCTSRPAARNQAAQDAPMVPAPTTPTTRTSAGRGKVESVPPTIILLPYDGIHAWNRDCTAAVVEGGDLRGSNICALQSKSANDRNISIADSRHPCLPFKRRVIVWSQLGDLLLLSDLFSGLKFRQKPFRKKFERFADILVLVHTALLHEDDLVDSRILVRLDVSAHLLGSANSSTPSIVFQFRLRR